MYSRIEGTVAPLFLSHSAGGSGGVFIVNSVTCGTMVVKSANQVFQEVYALLFGFPIFLLPLVNSQEWKYLNYAPFRSLCLGSKFTIMKLKVCTLLFNLHLQGRLPSDHYFVEFVGGSPLRKPRSGYPEDLALIPTKV